MRRLLFSLSAGLLAFFVLSALAWAVKPGNQPVPKPEKEKWEFLGKHEQGDMYLDSARVKRQGDLVIYWGKRVFFKPQIALDKRFKYQEQHVLHEVDCKKRTVTFVGMRFFDKRGKMVAESQGLREGPRPIEPTGFIIKGVDRFCHETAVRPGSVPAKAAR